MMTASQKFEPSELTVAVGEEVSFANDSKEAHTVTAYEGDLGEGAAYFASGGFGSEEEARSDLSGGLIDPGDVYTVSFEEPGTYRYFCIPHESVGMVGTVVVTP